jgi:dTDP-4-dehydrorhamnose reductase
MKRDKVIYSISVKDIYTVTAEVLERAPTKKEINFIEEKIGDYIEWYDIIESLLREFKLQPEEIENINQ